MGGGKSGRRDRRVFSDEFKREAVRLANERADGVSYAKVARDLDVRPSVLVSWVKAQRPSSGAPATRRETVQQELRRLRREVEELRQERDFAKKAAAFFAKESR